MSPHMTIAEMQSLLGIGRQAVYDGCSRDEIPHLRVGRRIIFPREAVMNWFRSATRRPLPSRKAG